MALQYSINKLPDHIATQLRQDLGKRYGVPEQKTITAYLLFAANSGVESALQMLVEPKGPNPIHDDFRKKFNGQRDEMCLERAVRFVDSTGVDPVLYHDNVKPHEVRGPAPK